MKKLIAFILGTVLSLFSLQSFAQSVTDYRLEDLVTTDTYIRSSLPNNSFGADQNLVTGGWGDAYISMLKFDISSIPIIVQGDRVSLWLYNKSPGGAAQPTAVNIGPSAGSFTNNSTWNNAGLMWRPDLVKQVNVSAYGYWTEFNITEFFYWWKTNQLDNNGILIVPLNTDNYFNFFSSSNTSTPTAQKPIIRVIRPLKLKWPLSTAYSSRVVTQKFGSDWAGGTTCSTTGIVKKHNGTDYRAAAGVSVYAAEVGIVKNIFTASSWANVITIEHTKADNSKFTTNYWHVNPYVAVGSQVNRGDLIAEVANLGGNTHFHFGIRSGAHLINSNSKDVSSSGALPQTNCDGWPAFPENFIDSESSLVLFQ